MSYIQMIDVLNEIKKFSNQLYEAYEDLAEATDDLVLRHCLAQAARQEQKLIEGLTDYIVSAPPRILQVWFQSPGLRHLRSAIKIVEAAAPETIDDVIAMIIQCDKILLGLYQSFSSALSQDVRDVFTHLTTVRLQSSRNWVWQASRPSS